MVQKSVIKLIQIYLERVVTQISQLQLKSCVSYHLDICIIETITISQVYNACTEEFLRHFSFRFLK